MGKSPSFCSKFNIAHLFNFFISFYWPEIRIYIIYIVLKHKIYTVQYHAKVFGYFKLLVISTYDLHRTFCWNIGPSGVISIPNLFGIFSVYLKELVSIYWYQIGQVTLNPSLVLLSSLVEILLSWSVSMSPCLAAFDSDHILVDPKHLQCFQWNFYWDGASWNSEFVSSHSWPIFIVFDFTSLKIF